MPFFVFLGIGVFTGRIFTMSLIGIVITRFYGSFLQKASEKYFLHLCYWKFGVSVGKSTIVPNAFDREFIVWRAKILKRVCWTWKAKTPRWNWCWLFRLSASAFSPAH
ncbi:type IV conjugative transfer system protein TraL [Providencia sp. CRE-138-0111]|uniref:Type IV conjugative transfer system protein TraL n=1 Tax=Providencia huashanensis TaxID=3037798 RepID=A0ABT9AV64_9GAMM|nr:MULTISPECIES: type IV conjugative transfer system protein TraL [Providencia]MDO7831693.1 type IV conjugative transfer system protein TraL [Providencia sp. CRE-138-0026]MDO7858182.1 type IV conjugative transfer system protein TraL [Providencia sp. CRE-138-0111]